MLTCCVLSRVDGKLVQFIAIDIGRCQKGSAVIDVLFDDSSLEQTVLQGRHDEVMCVSSVVDNVLQVNANLFSHAFEEVLENFSAS